jgi:GTP cyclohydrolase IA
MSAHFRHIITALGEDVNREGLADTPDRAAKALEFLTRG